MAKFRPYFEIELSTEYSKSEREAIALEIIDEIITRTENGKDKNGESFAPYSPAYIKEKGQSNVDLTFSGDMLASMELIANNKGKIRIGYSKDYDGLGKLEGNMLGTYGNKKPVTKPRDFLGIPKSDLNSILSNFPIDNKEERIKSTAESTLSRQAAVDLMRGATFDDEP